eukprot:scaffold214466_cov18-Prasinocladus_malaysianus.AAC.1
MSAGLWSPATGLERVCRPWKDRRGLAVGRGVGRPAVNSQARPPWKTLTACRANEKKNRLPMYCLSMGLPSSHPELGGRLLVHRVFVAGRLPAPRERRLRHALEGL